MRTLEKIGVDREIQLCAYVGNETAETSRVQVRLRHAVQAKRFPVCPQLPMRRSNKGEQAMKPETEKGLREASTELRQEIIRKLAELMTADDFIGALFDDGDLTNEGSAILSALTDDSDADEDEPQVSYDDATRLHEAICEGRKQDAVDILNEITGENFRSFREQKNLFPDRCSHL